MLIINPVREMVSHNVSLFDKSYDILKYHVMPKFRGITEKELLFKAAGFIGGRSVSMDINKLKDGISIVVGTPGRITDLIKRGSLQVEDLRYLIIDGAYRFSRSDKLKSQINKIIKLNFKILKICEIKSIFI